MDVALQLVAFKEPGLSATMDAWAAQPTPEDVSVSYEAWITPDGPKAACGTWQQATEDATFTAFEAPQYKLRARNAAHDSAAERGFDAFLVCDADAPPVTDDALSALLGRLREPGVGAAVSRPVSPPTPFGLLSNVGVVAKEVIGGVHGQTHALTTRAWQAAGPFADDVDHTDLRSVWAEEEYRFGHRLRQAARVEYVRDARVYNDTRRSQCRLRRGLHRPGGEFCDRQVGAETFHPR